jgi:hypothetical protein
LRTPSQMPKCEKYIRLKADQQWYTMVEGVCFFIRQVLLANEDGRFTTMKYPSFSFEISFKGLRKLSQNGLLTNIWDLICPAETTIPFF